MEANVQKKAEMLREAHRDAGDGQRRHSEQKNKEKKYIKDSNWGMRTDFN